MMEKAIFYDLDETLVCSNPYSSKGLTAEQQQNIDFDKAYVITQTGSQHVDYMYYPLYRAHHQHIFKLISQSPEWV